MNLIVRLINSQSLMKAEPKAAISMMWGWHDTALSGLATSLFPKPVTCPSWARAMHIRQSTKNE